MPETTTPEISLKSGQIFTEDVPDYEKNGAKVKEYLGKLDIDPVSKEGGELIEETAVGLRAKVPIENAFLQAYQVVEIEKPALEQQVQPMARKIPTASQFDVEQAIIYRIPTKKLGEEAMIETYLIDDIKHSLQGPSAQLAKEISIITHKKNNKEKTLAFQRTYDVAKNEFLPASESSNYKQFLTRSPLKRFTVQRMRAEAGSGSFNQ